MSILAGKLLLASLVPVVGTGAAYPLITKLVEKGQIELTKMQDFEKHCFVSIQGEAKDGEENGFNKKLYY